MLKTIIKLQNGANEVKENVVNRITEKLSNNKGVVATEILLLIIIVAGILVVLGIAFKASFAKWAATFDTIITDKIDAVK